jgi:hypothetical protein
VRHLPESLFHQDWDFRRRDGGQHDDNERNRGKTSEDSKQHKYAAANFKAAYLAFAIEWQVWTAGLGILGLGLLWQWFRTAMGYRQPA